MATKLVARSFLLSLISQYDAYLGELLRAIYKRKPEILKLDDKEIKFRISLSMAASKNCATA